MIATKNTKVTTMLKLLAVVIRYSIFGLLLASQTLYAQPVQPDWMKDLSDSTRIVDLTIPGTHDSAADRNHCLANPDCNIIDGIVTTQEYPIPEQLTMGIRFFDIRLALETSGDTSTLRFHHGPYDLGQTLKGVIDQTLAFLDNNPSEFVIFLIKQENTDKPPDFFWFEIDKVLDDYDQSRFYRGRVIHTAGELRNKIVIMAREYDAQIKQGFHVEWEDNTKHYEGHDGVLRYVVEDHYKLNSVNLNTKLREIWQNLALADLCMSCGDPGTLYITFTSGEGDVVLKTPHACASYINPRMSDWLDRRIHSYGPRRGIVAMDFAGLSDIGGDRLIESLIAQNPYQYEIAGWVGSETDGAGIASAHINDNDTPDLIVLWIDNPSGGNQGYYRIGLDVDQNGDPSQWLDHQPIPWLGGHQQGGGITAADMNGDGIPDLIVFLIDNPIGTNKNYYRIGYMGVDGKVNYWTHSILVPGWAGREADGGGIATADINGNGIPDLITLWIDATQEENQGYYHIGLDLKTDGTASRWLDHKVIPWSGAEQQGGGIAVANLDGNPAPELVVFAKDTYGSDNFGSYRIGWNMSSSGVISNWTEEYPVGWFGGESQGAGVTVANLDTNAKQEVILFWIHNSGGENRAFYRIVRNVAP